jgi:hypothetical protein
MNEQDATSTNEHPEQPPELPPIPDGGLGKGMPPWLAEPPARPSKLAGEPTPLDLHTLAGTAELPQWLGDLSNRVDRDAGVISPDEVDPPVEAQVPTVEEIVEEQEIPPVLATDVVEAAAIAAPTVVPSEPLPGPKKESVAGPRPLSETKVELTPEPRSRSTYLLLVLAMVVVVALAAWLIWG